MHARNINRKERKQTDSADQNKTSRGPVPKLIGAIMLCLTVGSGPSYSAKYDRTNVPQGGTAILKYGVGPAPDVELMGRYLMYTIAVVKDNASSRPDKLAWELYWCRGGVSGTLDLGNSEKWLTLERYLNGGCSQVMSPLTSQSDNPTDANAAAEALKRTSGIRPNAWYLQLGMKTALANGVYTGGFPDQSKIENRLPFADYVPVSINGCWSCKGERRPGIGTSVVVDLDQLYIHEFDTTTLLESQLEFVIDQITLSTMIDNK